MRTGDAQRLARDRRPAAHAEGVGDDTRAGLELRHEARLQLADQVWQQVNRDNARRREVGGKDIALHEAHALANAGTARILARRAHELAIELDAQSPGAEALRRRYDDAAVP